MADRSTSTPFATYDSDRARFCSSYRQETSEQTRTDAIRHSPLISLAVKHAVDNPKPKINENGSNTEPKSCEDGNNTSCDRPLIARTTSSSVPTSTAPSSGTLFGQTNAPNPTSQHAPSVSSPPALSQPTSSSTFGKPNLQSAPFSQYSTLSPAPTIFGTTNAVATRCSFGQAAQPQHKRQPSLQSGTVSVDSVNKALKSGENTSPTDERPMSSGALSKSVPFGGKENKNPSSESSFTSSSQLQTNGGAASRAANSSFVPGAEKPKTSSPSAFNFDFKPFGSGTLPANSSEGAPGQSRVLAKPKKHSSLSRPAKKELALPQYGLIGFDLDNCNEEGKPEPILLNTNSPNSVFLCGSQGSGKSYTLSCMLENHLLHDPSVGVQKQTIPGFVFHWDTNTSGSLAEAASLCSRGINVRLLVSWSNYRQMKSLYENFASKSGGKIEVRPLLFQDTELTVAHIRNLMAFRDASQETPLYLEVIQNILRRLGRKSEQFSVRTFLNDLAGENFNKSQSEMLDLRLNILKSFSAVTAPDVVTKDYEGCKKEKINQERKNLGLGFSGDCIRVEHGTLTIIDLSDPFVDASTACVLFDICLAVILKRHKEAVTANRISPGLIITLDEAHKFLDKDIPSADIFTASLLTTIREQRHNAARVVIATQEPTISSKLLDLCSVSIVHRFNSPAWFNTLSGHLGAASKLAGDDDESETVETRARLFERILALQVGESLVFSPTSYVRGGTQADDGEAVEPAKLGSGILRMKTREGKGADAGKTWNVV